MSAGYARAWLEAARDDLRVIENIIHLPDLTHMVAFHAHQAIEKSLKALIELQSQRVPKQHDLLKLKAMAGDVFAITDEDLLDTLNALYVDARYPGELGLLPYGKPTTQDAERFFAIAKEIFAAAQKEVALDDEA